MQAVEYIRAMELMLLCYSIGVADEIVEHRLQIGFDVWRRFPHHDTPLARNLHIIRLHDGCD